jgi:hypothetical protein
VYSELLKSPERTFWEFHELLPDEEEREVLAKQEEEETNRIELVSNIICRESKLHIFEYRLFDASRNNRLNSVRI